MPEDEAEASPPEDAVGRITIGAKRYAVVVAPRPKRPHTIRRETRALLTRRELQISLAVAEGLANKEIAAQLRISTWTVATHLRRIFFKLGVCTRAAMVYRLTQVGTRPRKEGPREP